MRTRTRIALLGGFAVHVGGTTIPESSWRLRKSRGVVKLLALTPGRALHPERLQALLWPGRDSASASNNLRQATYHARRALAAAGADAGSVLVTRGELLALAPEVEVDVDRFEEAAARAEASDSVAALEAALALYGGELLPEDIYEDWAGDRRRALAERHGALLLALAAQRDPAAAVDPLSRALAAEPLNEDANRALMRAYAATGRRQQALAQYQQLRRLLRDELAADPEPETRELYRGLLAEGAPEPETADEDAVSASAAAPPPQRRRPRHNLPWQPTSFVGRSRELAELDRLLSARRLVTLTGPGGCGKTRLALELARRRTDRHRDGAWLAELAAVTDGGVVGQAVASSLGLDLRPDEEPEIGLARHLAERELLLVLDNCEHLLGACARLAEVLLARCPGVVLLTTSRQPLHLPGEVDWRVPSMTMLDTGLLSDVGALAAADAVELFRDRARSANPRFELTIANAQAVAEICARVDGLPLAIELAAARTGALAPAEIAARLGDGLGVLRAARAGGLTRQQTLEGTLDWSHELLGEGERVLFRRLAAFNGGFEVDAAEAICSDERLPGEDVLDTLAGLVDKSLVNVDDAGASYRYGLLEPVRQYALAKLRASGELARQVERHASWFAALTDAPGGRVTDLDPAWVDRLERDHDNLRGAMDWLLAHCSARALEVAAGMTGLWLLRAHLREGARWLDRTLAATTEASPARADALHARQALERRRPQNYDLADRLSDECIAIRHACGDPRNEALALLDLAEGAMLRGWLDHSGELAKRAGEIAGELGDAGLSGAARERAALGAAWRHQLDAADAGLTEALALYESAPADAAPASAVISLSGFLPEEDSLGRYPVARLEETILHFRRLRPLDARASLLSHRAYIARCRGRHDEARTHLDSALEIVHSGGSVLDEARLAAQRGALEARAGELDDAETWLRTSLTLREEVREHRGILLTLAALAIVADLKGQRERAGELVARALRMAQEVVDGPALGGILLARAEIERARGELEAARQALDAGLAAFYGITGLQHWASWVHLQHAYLSLELEDLPEVGRRLELARGGFAVAGARLGLDHCAALAERLQAANGLLTAARSTGGTPQRIKEDS